MNTRLEKSLWRHICYSITAAALLLACPPEAVSATAVYAVTLGGSLYKSTDSAKSWQQIPLEGVNAATYAPALAIDPQNPGNIYLTLLEATGKGSASGGGRAPLHTLFRSADGGQSWSQSNLPSAVSPTRLAVDPASSNTIYAGTGTGLFRSTDSGATFGSATLSGSIMGISTDPHQAGVVYATALTNGSPVVYKSTDYGSTWAPLANPAGTNSAFVESGVAVDPRNSSVLYAPLADGFCATCGLSRSADGGKTWAVLTMPGYFYNVVIDSRDGAIYAGGMLLSSATQPAAKGQVVKSTDGGKTWTSLSAGFSSYAVQVHLDPNVNSTLYAVPRTGGTPASPGVVFVSANTGAAWTPSPVAPQTAPNDAILAIGVASGTSAAGLPPTPAGTVTQTVSAASQQSGPVAAESIVMATGSHLATGAATGDYDQPPMTLAGTTVNVKDAAGITRPAVLFSVSDTQVTYQIPPGTAAGPATVTIRAGDGISATTQVQIAAVAPGLYTLNAGGLVKAYVLRVSNGNTFIEDVYEIDGTGAVVARPITISNGDQVYLLAYGTGFRAAGGDISATLSSVTAPVLYAGPQGVQPGLDQFNVLIPPELATGGQQVVPIVLTAGGQTANTVNVTVQ